MEKSIIWKALCKTGKDILDNDGVVISLLISFIFLFITLPGISFIFLVLSSYMLFSIILNNEYDDNTPLYITNFIVCMSIINSIFSFYYFFNIPVFGQYITVIDINNVTYIPYIITSIISLLSSLIIVSIINAIIYTVKLFFENFKKIKTTNS